jgi:CHASE2 domain-containing sensor protein
VNGLPVFPIAITAGMVLMAVGITLFLIPRPRRPRSLLLAWAIIASLFALGIVANFVRIMADLS